MKKKVTRNSKINSFFDFFPFFTSFPLNWKLVFLSFEKSVPDQSLVFKDLSV